MDGGRAQSRRDRGPPQAGAPRSPRRCACAKRVLFVCTQNLLRSPTAERIFSGRPGLEVASAGLAPGAPRPVSAELLEWADLVLVMEPWHERELARRFPERLARCRVICLDIPDRYGYMDAALVRLLEEKAGPLLESPGIEGCGLGARSRLPSAR